MPTFSIIIPFFNTEPQYYQKTFSCLKDVPQAVAEVIVVDDGSDYSSHKELRDFLEAELPWARLYRKDNGGQNSARQLGIDNATGDYVLFLDSDDYLDVAALMELADYLARHQPSIVAFNYDKVTSGGKTLGTCGAWEPGFHKISLQRLSLASDSLWRQCYCLQRLRELPFGLVQGIRVGEDLSSALSINLALEDCVSYGGVLFHYVKRSTSMIHNTPKEVVYDVLVGFDEVIKRCGPGYSGCRDEVEWMAILHCIGWNSLRLMRAGVDPVEARQHTFDWMQGRFPKWRLNPYLDSEPVCKQVWFRLAVTGRWKILRLSIGLWDSVKTALLGGGK